MTPLEKLKGLLVSACEAKHEGHNDISSNLLELASECIGDVTPEDIEVHFNTNTVDNGEIEAASYEDDGSEIEPLEELSDAKEHRSLYDLVAGMVPN